LTDLVALGRSRGFVTMGDVTTAIDRAELTGDALDGVVRVLADEGIEVLDAQVEEEPDTKLPDTRSSWPSQSRQACTPRRR
jgi:RNA polymerase primary sigma factor